MTDDIFFHLDSELAKQRQYEPVIAEIPISNGQLHKIASGNCCMMSSAGEMFAVRFLLKSSFKSARSNYVVNNFVMQIIALGKNNVLRKENISTLTKLVKSEQKPEKKPVEMKQVTLTQEEAY